VSERQTLASEYFRVLAAPVGASVSDDSPAKAALARAHELRKFEIENYWKRATYFWVFQLAAFTLLGLIWPQILDPKGPLQPTALMIPAGLGSITALVGLLTAKGSKFWQENWEAHVDALEGDVEGRLTQIIFVKRWSAFSVSRVNERLLLLLMTGWFVFFLIAAFQLDAYLPRSWQAPLGLVTLLAISAWITLSTRTDLSGLQIGPEGIWTPIARAARRAPGRRRLILRDTFLGPARAPDQSDIRKR
jgi:hypothetical protein